VIAFRPFREDDLSQLHEWFQREHVERWWRTEPTTLERTRERYLPAIDGRDPTDLYAILLDDAPIGMIQTYLVSDYPEFAQLTETGQGVAGIDLFIGEAELTGHGLGTEIIRTFVEQIVFARPETVACIADPDALNVASLRAFAKAGFRDVGEVEEETGPCRLLRLDRHG
jgi:aminoglycoside 6'-N-acetyltransferase